jgi:hypothetical protein
MRKDVPARPATTNPHCMGHIKERNCKDFVDSEIKNHLGKFDTIP